MEWSFQQVTTDVKVRLLGRDKHINNLVAFTVDRVLESARPFSSSCLLRQKLPGDDEM